MKSALAGWSQSRTRCTSGDAQRASALGVPVNSASLCVTRRYRDASGQVLLLSQTHHPAERFTYSFDLLRGGDGSAWLAA